MSTLVALIHMNQLTVDRVDDAKTIKLTFHGSLSEMCSLPEINVLNKMITVDLLDLKYINSYGIKLWCQWVQKYSHITQISFENVPFVFVKHISVVKGFWAPNMVMISFFVPFYSDVAEERKDILFVEGTNFTRQGVREIPKVLDSQGKEMEIDVNKKTYFEFLKK